MNRRNVRRLDFLQKIINAAFAPCLALLCGRGGADGKGVVRRMRNPNASSGQRQVISTVLCMMCLAFQHDGGCSRRLHLKIPRLHHKFGARFPRLRFSRVGIDDWGHPPYYGTIVRLGVLTALKWRMSFFTHIVSSLLRRPTLAIF